MDESGKSKRRAYVQEGDILSSAYGQHFYDTFFQKMDQAEKSHVYGAAWEWKPIAYDWRMSLHDIVSNGAQYGNRIYYEDATSTPYIEQSLRALASSSPTGKVTIIAHSNGGMIAKELLKRLGDAEASRLVDTLILVGTPQSGAPRALGALLYGDAEGIPAVGRFANLIISSAHAREFALNSPMAYQLLPSANYMSARNEKYPLVRFGSGTLLAHQRALYGDVIDTDAELQEYLLGDSGARSAPDASDLTHASVANANLLADATDAHDSLDAWTPPSGIQVYQIGGYGVDTVSGIDTYEAPSRSGKDALSYLPLFTQEGDGTVPIISSFMMNAIGNVHDIWVDMSRLSTGIDYSHGTMFEVPDIENAIDTILQAPLENTSTTTLYAAPMNDEPSMKSQKRISFFVHSPSSLTVTDTAGNQTHVRSGGTSIQAIPGSESGTFGEVEFITVPADGSYSVSITDMSPGEVTFDMQDRNGGDVTATSTIAAIPVTASSVVSATIENTIGSTSPLDVDENGDGTVDLSITPVLGTTIISPDVPVQANGTSSTSYVRTVVVEHVKKALSAVRELAKPLGFSAVSPVVSDHASTSPLATTSIRTPSRDSERSGIHAQDTTTESATMTPVGREEQDVPTDQRRPSWWGRLLYLLEHLWHDILAFLGVTSR
jgi:pimeloyl-ACP methyl ester carboxylesterase